MNFSWTIFYPWRLREKLLDANSEVICEDAEELVVSFELQTELFVELILSHAVAEKRVAKQDAKAIAF